MDAVRDETACHGGAKAARAQTPVRPRAFVSVASQIDSASITTVAVNTLPDARRGAMPTRGTRLVRIVEVRAARPDVAVPAGRHTQALGRRADGSIGSMPQPCHAAVMRFSSLQSEILRP